MARKKQNVGKSNSLFKKGMGTHVKNMPKRPSRGGIRL